MIDSRLPENIQVLILAGGFGTRLRSVIQELPKPMAPIAKKPFLEHLLLFLKKQGFQNITILTGYKSESIQEYFGDGQKLKMKITYSHEQTPLGTGGAIAQAMQACPQNNFLVLNGDSFFSMNLPVFLQEAKAPASIALREIEDASRYGSVQIDTQKNITAFQEKSSEKKSGLINAGIYFLAKDINQYFPKNAQFSIEKDVFEKLASRKMITGCLSEGHFIDIGIPESYAEAQTLIPKWIDEYDVTSI